MQACYVNALVSAPPVVLGRRLLPLSLGHVAVLDACGSPFVRGEEWQAADVVFAVWACSQPQDALRAAVNADPDRLAREARRWGRRCKPWQIAAAAPLLVQYVIDGMAAPRRWDSPEAKRVIPWWLSVAWSLMGGDVTREEYVWAMPAARAIAYASAEAARRGDESLMSEDEIKVIDEARKAKAASNG